MDDDDEMEAQMAALAAAVEAAEAAEARADGGDEPRVGACGGGERPARAHQPALSGGDRAELFRRARLEKTSVHASAFTVGYVCRKLLAKFKCQSCKRSLLTNDHSSIHSWIEHRERSLLRGTNLKYPKPELVVVFRTLIDKINEFLNNSPHRPNVMKNIKAEFLNTTTTVHWIGCQQHHKDALNFFITLTCRIQIHNFCTTINKILKGSYSEDLINPNLAMQKLALEKYKKTSAYKKKTRNV
ncbi:hypothetical protein O0L34_g9353 [Tuta absoluta]|nr:hypothetical protein O0L34_g9353 [Tuta absoluta]